MSAGNQLVVENISFSYHPGKSPIVKGLHFEIAQGSILSIIGMNGSGKTTMLKLILGYYTPEDGTIRYHKDHQSLDIKETNGFISYLPQFEQIPHNFTVRDYILLGRLPSLSFFGIPGEQDVEYVMHIMKDLALMKFQSLPIGEISGGELQRVRIARAIAQETDIILLDEPTTHLDIANKQMIFSLLKKLKGTGKIVTFSTNEPNEALNFSDYCLLMNKTRSVQFGEPNRVITPETLSKYFHVHSNLVEIEGQTLILYK